MKFKIGDKARLVYTRTNSYPGWVKGAIVVIKGYVNITPRGNKADYIVFLEGAFYDGYVLEEQLEPITKQEIGSWEKLQELGWSPTKEVA